MTISKTDRENLQNFFQMKAYEFWNRYRKMPEFVRIGECPKIKMNGRIYKTAGQTVVKDSIVELSLKLYMASNVNKNALINVILPHELAHQMDVNLYGIPKGNRWHGPSWSAIMVKIGLPPNPYHELDL